LIQLFIKFSLVSTLLDIMTKTILILTLFITLSLCLKHSEVGRNDWHLENIG